MQKNGFEKQLAKKLHDTPSPLQLDEAWARLEVARSKRRKRRAFWWLFSGLAGIFLSAVLLIVIFGKDEIDRPMSLPDPSPDAVVETSLSPLKARQNQADTPIEASLEAGSQIQTPTLGSLPSPIAEASVNLPSVRYNPSIASGNIDATRSTDDPEAGQGVRNETWTPHQIIDNIHPQDFPQTTVGDRPYDRLSILPARWVDLQTTSSPENVPRLTLHEVPGPVPPKSRRLIQRPWSLSFVGLYGTLSRHRTSVSADVSQEIAERNFQEEAVDGFGGDVVLEKYIAPRLFVRTGIGFSRYSDRWAADTQASFVENRADQVVRVIRLADGSVVEEIGAADVTVDRWLDVRVWQKHDRWSVPLSLGLDIVRSSRWRLRLASGFSYAVRAQKRGLAWNASSLSTLTFTDLSQDGHRSSGLWAAHAQLEWQYRLGQHWSAMIGATGRRDLSSVYPKSVGFSEKYSLWGLQLGLTWHW